MISRRPRVRSVLVLGAIGLVVTCGKPESVLRGTVADEPPGTAAAGAGGITAVGVAGATGAATGGVAGGAKTPDAGSDAPVVGGSGGTIAAGSNGEGGAGGLAGARDASAPDVRAPAPPDLRPACADGSLPTDDPLIDFEDGAGRALARAGRSGSDWHTFSSSAALPLLGVAASPSPACSSTKALHVTIAGHTDWSGIRQELADRAIDLTAFAGVAFWAKAAAPTTWMFLAPDAQSEPSAMLCGGAVACKDHVLASFDVGTTWKRYVIRFADMTRRTSGAAAPRIDVAHVYAVEWQFGVNEGVDGWLDDVALVK